jgi:hypothetical protein
MKHNDSNGDLIFAIPIALIAIALMIWRRAHTISSQFGYELWSYDMWIKLRFQMLAALVLVVVVGLIRWVWRRSSNR